MQPNSKRDLLYLLRLLNHIELCSYFTKDVESEEDLIDNHFEKFHLATSQLVQMAENANKLSSIIKENNNDIKWQKIKGFRNIIIHEYINIDSDIVFDIIKIELPNLKNKIINIIQIGLVNSTYDINEFMIAKESEKYALIDFTKFNLEK